MNSECTLMTNCDCLSCGRRNKIQQLERELHAAQLKSKSLEDRINNASEGIDADIFITGKIDEFMTDEGYTLPETDADEDDNLSPYQALCMSMISIFKDLHAAQSQVAGLRDYFEHILRQEPCCTDGNCFYPMCDSDGEYIGEQQVDPLGVIQGMTTTAREALSAPAVAMVPWEVVKEYRLARNNFEHHPDTESNIRFSNAWADLQSYAPSQPKEKE